MRPFGLSYPRLALAVFALAVVVGVGVAGASSPTSFSLYNGAWDGGSDMTGVANDEDATVTVARSTGEYDRVPASESVAIVLSPDRTYDADDVERLRAFVETGGTLVVADDYDPHSNRLLADLGVDARLHGAPLRDEQYYGSSPAFPEATGVRDHPLTEGVDRLTLNHGTAVEPNGATVLVNSSQLAYLDTNRDGGVDRAEPLGPHPVAVSERVGDGRVVVVGDPSIFVNAMLDRPGNRQFARNLVTGDEHVVLDHSHADRVPPLAAARLSLQRSPLLGGLVGLLVVAGIGAAARRENWVGAVRRRLPGRFRADDETAAVRVDEATIRQAVRDRHPDRDPDRIARVTSNVINQRQEREDDD